MDVNCCSVDNCSSLQRVAIQRGFSPNWASWDRSIVCYLSKSIISDPHKNRRISGFTNPGSVHGDSVQHGLDVGRRAGDDARISLVAVCCSNDSVSS